MRGHRDLLLICGGSAVSVFGTGLTTVALLLSLHSAGALVVSGLIVAGALPVVLAAPLAGLLVDRLANRRLMIGAELVQGAAVCGIAIAPGRVPVVLGLLAVTALGSAVARPAASALLPSVTGEDGATRGYAWLATGNSVGNLLGYAAGGALVAAVGVHWALVADALSYLAQAALLGLVEAERRPDRTGADAETGGRVTAGLRLLVRDRVLALVVGGLAVAVAASMLMDVAEVFFVTGPLHSGAATFGLLAGCWMAGMLAGARLAGRVRAARALAAGVGLGGLVMGLALAAPATWPVLAVSVAGFAIGGVANSMQNVCLQSLVRSRAPEAVRGRVFAAVSAVLQVAVTLGTLAGAGVVTAAGARGTFGIAAAGTALAGAIALAATRYVRVEREPVARTARTG